MTAENLQNVSKVICEDGRIAELVINPETGRVEFGIYNPSEDDYKLASQVTDGHTTYGKSAGVDYICTTGFGAKSGVVFLPTVPLDYGNQGELIREVREFIHSYVELDEAMEAIAAYYVLFTWLFDKFDEVPYLRFFAHDIGCGKSRALETVGTICYRPIFVGGSSTCASLRRMVDSYQGTIVADEQDCKGDQDLTTNYIKILNQGFQRGRPVIVCSMKGDDPTPQKFDVFGPKLIVTRTKFNDDALESRCFTVKMRKRTRDDIPLNFPRKEFNERALLLRNKLLGYRFDKYHRTEIDRKLQILEISDRLNQIAIPLLSIVESPVEQEKIANHFKDLQKELDEIYADSDAARIVQYLSDQWSDSDDDILIGDITSCLNGTQGYPNLVDLHPTEHLTARKVGQIIKDQLGLKKKRKGRGYVVVKDNQRLEYLQEKYCVEDKSTQCTHVHDGKTAESC